MNTSRLTYPDHPAQISAPRDAAGSRAPHTSAIQPLAGPRLTFPHRVVRHRRDRRWRTTEILSLTR